MIKVEFVPTDGSRGFVAEILLFDKREGRLVIQFDDDETEWEWNAGAWFDVNDSQYPCKVYVAKHGYGDDNEMKGS